MQKYKHITREEQKRCIIMGGRIYEHDFKAYRIIGVELATGDVIIEVDNV